MKKTNKDKGNEFEVLSANFWSKKLGDKVRQTPMSGALVGFSGDIFASEGVLKDFAIDIKGLS